MSPLLSIKFLDLCGSLSVSSVYGIFLYLCYLYHPLNYYILTISFNMIGLLYSSSKLLDLFLALDFFIWILELAVFSSYFFSCAWLPFQDCYLLCQGKILIHWWGLLALTVSIFELPFATTCSYAFFLFSFSPPPVFLFLWPFIRILKKYIF